MFWVGVELAKDVMHNVVDSIGSCTQVSLL